MKKATKYLLSLVMSLLGSLGLVACSSRTNLESDEIDKYESEQRWKEHYGAYIFSVHERLIEIISSNYGIEKSKIQAKNSLEHDLQLNNENILLLKSVIETSFAINIDQSEMNNFSTVEKLTYFIFDKTHPPCNLNWSNYQGTKYPDNLYYTKDGSWLRVEGYTAIVGIAHYLQDLIGPYLVNVELIEPNTPVKKGELIAVVESVKVASDVSSPVSGLVVDVNHRLRECPELIDKDTYGNGWIMKIIMSDVTELNSYLSAEQYKQFLKEHNDRKQKKETSGRIKLTP